MKIFVGIIFGLTVMGAGACFCGYFYFAYAMWQGRKPGIRLRDVLWNPFNIWLDTGPGKWYY